MIAAGIDVLLPVYWGTPLSRQHWSDEGLSALVAARERLISDGKNPPAIGMFYDTSTLQYNEGGYHIDLTTPSGRQWFYGTIRNFWNQIPPQHRARIDGKPLVFLYASAFARHVDEELSPAVPVIRDDDGQLLAVPYLVSMITAPAVNAGAVRANEPQNVSQIEPVMLSRIERLLSVAVVHHHRCPVLGAWGCGVFKNGPADVARWFHAHLGAVVLRSLL